MDILIQVIVTGIATGGGRAKNVAPCFILFLILMIRPYGLFGKRLILRV